MRIGKMFRLLVLGISIVSIFTLSVVFATVTQTLTISTDVEITTSPMNVSFFGDGTETDINDGEVLLEGSIDGTSFEGLSIKLTTTSISETRFSVINDSEYANVMLTGIELATLEDIENGLFDISLWYNSVEEERSMSLLPLLYFENQDDAYNYLIENLDDSMLSYLGFGCLIADTESDPENQDYSDTCEVPDIRDFVLDHLPIIRIYKVDNGNELLYTRDFKEGINQFNSEVPGVLSSENTANEESDRIENYILRIESPADINIYLKLKFNYQQV